MAPVAHALLHLMLDDPEADTIAMGPALVTTVTAPATEDVTMKAATGYFARGILLTLIAGTALAAIPTEASARPRPCRKVVVVKKSRPELRTVKVWVPGHWVATRGHRVWVKGHWKVVCVK